MSLALNGNGGNVKLEGVAIAFLNNWKSSINGAELDTTKFGDTDKRRAIGIKSATGSMAGTFTPVDGISVKPGTLGAVMMETASTSMTDEATTANQAKTVFTITDTDKQFISLDPADAPVVKYNGTPVADPTDYVINYAKGTITFTVSPGNNAVTISGKYITLEILPGFTKFSLDTSVGTYDVTQFVALNDANYGWKRIIGGLGEWSASCDGFLGDSDVLDLIAVSASTPKHFAFVMDQTNLSSLVYGQGSVQKVDNDTPVANVISQSLNIVSASTLYRTEENALWTAYQARQLVTLSLVPKTGDSIEGEAIITKLNISNDVNGVATFTADYEIDGAVTVSIV